MSDDDDKNPPVSHRQPTSDPLLFSGAATRDLLLTLFDGCRIYEKAAHRHYASIEITLFSVISIISGARPKENCESAAFAMGSIALLHLLYIFLIRPFRTLLDKVFSIVNTSVLVVLSICVAMALRKRNEENGALSTDDVTLKATEWCLWLISVLGFVQLGVQGYWAYHVAQRRKQRERENLDTDGSDRIDFSADSKAEALLTVHSSSSSSEDDREMQATDQEQSLAENEQDVSRRATSNPLVSRRTK